ncbi:MAG: CdaR family protein [Clostridia bacterium]|nr:CdaR family protein [Clostridia bacterium]
MKKIFENDRMLKVVSVVIAAMIWLYIIIILDPAYEVTVRDLPIQFIGGEQLNANGLSVVNESDTAITIKVQGSRKKLGRNNMKSIIAKVDLSAITAEGTTALPVDVVVPFENLGITAQDPYTVDIKVERLVEKTMNIEIKTEGSLAEGYMAGPMHTEIETVTVKGPESVVGKIARAAVVLNYGNADVDIDKELPIRLYNTEDKEISANDSILNRIEKNISQTKVHCTVVKLKRVDVVAVFDNDNENKIQNELSYKLSPSTVQIYGDEQITSQIFQIRTEPVSFEKLVSNQKTKVKLVVPEGVKVLQDIYEVEITLTAKPEN